MKLVKRLAVVVALTGLALVVMAPATEARRSGQNPVQPGKNNCRLAKGTIKMSGYPVYDLSGTQVATKRVTILWRYVDANCDGQMTWGVGPAEGADYLRIVPRTIYDFTSAITPAQDANGQIQISTHHFGPFDPTLGAGGAFRPTAFREVHHDDLILGLPAPGDFVVTQGMDGLPIPGLTISVHLFTDSGDVISVPGVATTWGARFVLTVDPLLSNGTIPAGAFAFMDSQLNAYDIVPSADGTCEFGFSEEDWINANGGGSVQAGPNTANTNDPNVVSVPVHFAPQCSNNTP
ncbi:MAG: hypothetical protein ACE5JQ_13135 [Candidatus Methylomirabilales bacterium]